MPGDYSYPGQYAALIEKDLGVTVSPHTIVISDMMTDEMLDGLRTNERWRNALGKAKVVTFVAGFDELTYVILNDVRNGTCGGDDDLDCIRDLMTAMGANYDAIYAELFSLCQPGTIIRTETYPFVTLKGFYYEDEIRPYVELLNETIIQTAAVRYIPVAMVHEAFNWPGGTGDPSALGYTGDWLPTTKLGAEKIAELLRDLGYEPTVP